MPDELWTETFERTPGGRVIRYAAIPGMRLREVEIHHVDLDAGFSPRGWSDAFASHLIGAMVKRAPSDTSFRVLATDLASDLGDRRRPRRVRHDRLRTRRRPRPGG